MQVQNKEQIFQLMAENRPALKRFSVDRFGLFGSFVTDRQNSISDVELLLDFEPGRKSFDSFMSVAFFLEDILGRKVDLITRESMSPHIGLKILAEVEYSLSDRGLSFAHIGRGTFSFRTG